MFISIQNWKKVFLFCLGILLGAAFCMKWLEAAFRVNGENFTIIGLEISYPQQKVAVILSALQEPVVSLLRYQLIFDFIFMAGVYPGIAALCMMGASKAGAFWKRILVSLALLQLLAWAADIYENYCLLKWIKDPSSISGFETYHLIVSLKWALALIALLFAIPFAVRRRKP
jgi:hypothetical protein